MPEIEIIKLARGAWTPLGIAALVLILLYWVSKLALRATVGSSEDTRRDYSDRLYSIQLPTPLAGRIFSRFWILALVVACLAFVAYALPSFLSDTSLRGVVVYESTNDTVEGARVSVDGYPQLNYVTQKDGNFLITIPNRQRQSEYRVRAWLLNPPTTLIGSLLVTDGDASKKSLTVPLIGGSNVASPSPAGKSTTPATIAPSRRGGNHASKSESSTAPAVNNQSNKAESATVLSGNNQPNPGGRESSDFESRCREHQGDESQLAQLGEQAFSRLDYRGTIKCLEQAKRVQSSKVWESKYPLLAAAYLLGNHDRDSFKRSLQEMLGEMRLNNSYLHHGPTIGFVLQSLDYVKPYVDTDAQTYINTVVEPAAIQIKDSI